MSSDAEPIAENSFTPIQPPRSRKKHRLHPHLLGKWLYILITRVIFFIGLSVVVRSLGPLFTHVKSETKSIISSARGNRTLYQNQTLDEVTDRSKVVQPLLGENQLFDIGVTIWARATVEEETEWRKSLRGMNTTAESNQRWGFHDGPLQLRSWSYWETSSYLLPSQLFPRTISRTIPLFTMIHSDIAFKQLRLSDIASSTVNYSLPAKYFHRQNFEGLRAAFTLLPTSPSPLDNVKTFSSWINEDSMTPKRAWPFPLGSPSIGNKTLLDESGELLSFVMPMVRRLDGPNPCLNSSKDLVWASPYTQNPYIVSRTHIRMIKDLEIMNFASFNESHHDLKSKKCGKIEELNQRTLRFFANSRNDSEDMRMITTCRRDYLSTGILESLFELGIPLGNGSNRTEWAYAPYIEATKGGLGPKDFTPIPMAQVDCSRFSNPVALNASSNSTENLNVLDSSSVEALNISWHLTYSVMSVHERTMLDSFNSLMAPEKYPVTESDYSQVKTQDQVDQQNSIFGIHREGSSHPRRRLVLSFLSTTISVIAGAFDVLYWYTRTSSTFISIPGTILLAFANLINCEFIIQGRDAWLAYQFLLPQIQSDYRNGFTNFDALNLPKLMRSVLRILRFVFVAFIPLQTSWMLLTALRIELVWFTSPETKFLRRIIPTLRRIRPNHRERASERLERSTMRRRSQMAIVAALFVAYHLMLPHLPNLLDPLHPEPDPSILQEKMLYKDIILKESIVDPLFVSGTLFQLVLNNSSGFFAGSYRIAAILKAVTLALDLVQYIPWAVGLPESRGGMDAAFIIYGTMMVVAGWQAATLSRAPTDDDLEDE